jgi:hypothetical protein
VGGWEKFQKQKKLGAGRGENKVPKKKKRSGEKKNWEGGGEKIKLQRKTYIRAEKWQTRKVNMG